MLIAASSANGLQTCGVYILAIEAYYLLDPFIIIAPTTVKMMLVNSDYLFRNVNIILLVCYLYLHNDPWYSLNDY